MLRTQSKPSNELYLVNFIAFVAGSIIKAVNDNAANEFAVQQIYFVDKFVNWDFYIGLVCHFIFINGII